MKKVNALLMVICVMQIAISSHAQNAFNKGVNLSNWFQSNSISQLSFTKYSKQDLENIKSLGCDVIRLPLNLHNMTDGAPNYTISPLFFQFLDSVVTWAEELKMHLILDNHTFDPNADTPLNFDIPLRKEWIQMANHYKNRSKYILYEVLNEPHGSKLTTALWCKMQQTVIDTIRTVDTKHTIVVGASNFNSYTELKNMTIYSDTNLIYTFHFYDPFMFTHQGASWVKGMDSLKGVPYPYDKATMPSCPANAKGTWVESDLNNYIKTGTDESVKSLIDIAIAFCKQKNVKIYCGEFGVYNIYSNNADRVYWYNLVRNYLETNNIPWTSWDYQNGFGLFKLGSNEQFDYDLNIPLVQSLGFTEPLQSVYKRLPDSIGFPIYSDYIEKNILDDTWADSSKLNFYSNESPRKGQYCIKWQDTTQYSGLKFKILPVKDLSLLKSDNYAIDFFVRSNTPNAPLQVRFVDNKTSDTATHSWRMSYDISSAEAPGDNKWHRVHIPLTKMKETGAWDGYWSTPRGTFDWTSIGYLQFVAETKAYPKNTQIWFDQIIITDLDTAQLNDTTIQVFSNNLIADRVSTIKAFPNPLKQQTTITYIIDKPDFVEIAIYNTLGQKVFSHFENLSSAGNYSFVWQTVDIPNGLYYCKLKTKNNVQSIILLKE